MIKTITIDSRNVEINTSAGWLYLYRNRFGHDILPDILPLIESIFAAVAAVLEDLEGELTTKAVMESISNDTMVDAFVKVSGMETITVLNVLWAMAKNADPGTPDPVSFFNTFERFPVDEVVPVLFNAIVDSSVSSKNAERLLQTIRTMREKATESTSTFSPLQGSIAG